MAGLNVSLSFFFTTFVLCQAARRACKALLPAGAYATFAREAVGAAQLGACCLEMRTLAELGPWAGGFGPDQQLTLLFLLFLVHGATCDGASANPTVSLQELLLAEASVPGTLLRLAAQGLGVRAACALTRRYWAWELCDLHVLQNLMEADCASALRTPVPHGALVEGACAFFLHLTLLRLRNSPPAYRVPAVALLATVMAHTAGPFTAAFFNPALATSVTFHCSGHSLLEYMQVYWLGPLAGGLQWRSGGFLYLSVYTMGAFLGSTASASPGLPALGPGTLRTPIVTVGDFTFPLTKVSGMVLAVLLYHGRLPRLFRRNLLYGQKNKYRTPRGKLAPGPRDTRTPAEGSSSREPGRAGAERQLAGSR